MIALARKAGALVLIDPKGTDFERLPRRNAANAESVWSLKLRRWTQSEDELAERGMKLIADFDLSSTADRPYQSRG